MTPSALTQDYGLYIDDRESHKPEVDNACFAPETVQPEIIENEQRKVKPLQDFVQETNSEKVPPPKEATSPSSSAWNTRKTTILLLGAIVILIAIIAGVLGGFLGSRKSGGESQQVLTSLTKTSDSALQTSVTVSSTLSPNSGTSTLQTTKSRTTPFVTSGTIGMAELPCPTTSARSNDVEFEIKCGIDILSGIPATNGLPIGDIAELTVYRLADCLSICAVTLACASALYGANLTEMVALAKPGANCILKNGTLAQGDLVGTFPWKMSAIKLS